MVSGQGKWTTTFYPSFGPRSIQQIPSKKTNKNRKYGPVCCINGYVFPSAHYIKFWLLSFNRDWFSAFSHFWFRFFDFQFLLEVLRCFVCPFRLPFIPFGCLESTSCLTIHEK